MATALPTPTKFREVTVARSLLHLPAMQAALETTFAFALIGWTIVRPFIRRES